MPCRPSVEGHGHEPRPDRRRPSPAQLRVRLLPGRLSEALEGERRPAAKASAGVRGEVLGRWARSSPPRPSWSCSAPGPPSPRTPALKQGPAPEAVWPEFSEYECFACHHDLSNPSPFQTPGHLKGKPGQLPWETWPMAMLPEIAKGRDGIDLNAPELPGRAPGRDGSDRPRCEEGRRPLPQSVLQLDGLLRSLEAKPLDAAGVASLMKELASPTPVTGESWDRRAQQYLALSALARAATGLGVPVGPEIEAALKGKLGRAWNSLRNTTAPAAASEALSRKAVSTLVDRGAGRSPHSLRGGEHRRRSTRERPGGRIRRGFRARLF